MKRLALYILIYAIIGILFSICLNYALFYFLITTIFLTIFIVIYYKKLSFILLIIIAFIFFYIGLNAKVGTNTQLDEIVAENTPVTIQAIVTDKLKEYDDVTLYCINTKSIKYDDITLTDKLNMYVYIDKNLTIGDIISFNKAIKTGTQKRNESDYNEYLNYKIKNISYKSYPSEIDIIGHESNFITICNSISNSIRERLYFLYPDKEAGILTAMIVGDKVNLDSDIYELYSLAGIVHIIAISGLHISILAGIILFLLKPLNKKISSLIVMLFLLFYCIFTGGSVSVMRATIMMYFYILSGFLGRKYDLLSSTAVSCCLLLSYNPYYLFDLGFQYSYIAVFTIGFTSEILNKYKIHNKLLNLFIVSLAVTMATKPLTAHYFYYVNFIDVFVNIIAITLVEFILILALASIVVSFVYIQCASMLAFPAYFLLKIIEKTAKFSLTLPLSHITTGGISLLVVITLYVLLFGIYKLLMCKFKFIPVVTACIVIISISIIFKYNDFEAEFIYVGQGDCTILKDDNSCYFMDAGSNQFSPTGSKILSQLEYENIHKIDGIYISHMDYDHMGAILEIADDITIEKIFVSKYCEHNDNYNEIIDVANKNNIDIIIIDENYSENLTENMSIELVCVDKNAKDTNNSSLVYKVNCKDKSILFTGDIDTETEENFLNNNINADILKIPHHGSKYSASRKFITAVNPKLAINFAGYNNVYKHPSPETLELYFEMQIPLLRTDTDGMIKIRFYDNGIYYKLLNTNFKTIEYLFY